MSRHGLASVRVNPIRVPPLLLFLRFKLLVDFLHGLDCTAAPSKLSYRADSVSGKLTCHSCCTSETTLDLRSETLVSTSEGSHEDIPAHYHYK